MEDLKFSKEVQEIAYSRTVKAGKRMYYLDVKRSKNNDLFLSITESKKRYSGEGDDIQVSYEKHKIFLYKEDFDKFSEALEDVLEHINEENTRNGAQDIRSYKSSQHEEYNPIVKEEESVNISDKKYDIDIEF